METKQTFSLFLLNYNSHCGQTPITSSLSYSLQPIKDVSFLLGTKINKGKEEGDLLYGLIVDQKKKKKMGPIM